MFSGFQSNSFQSNAYQILRSGVTPPIDNGWLGGGLIDYKPTKKLKSAVELVEEEILSQQQSVAVLQQKEKVIIKKINKQENIQNNDAKLHHLVIELQQIKFLLKIGEEKLRKLRNQQALLVLSLSYPWLRFDFDSRN